MEFPNLQSKHNYLYHAPTYIDVYSVYGQILSITTLSLEAASLVYIVNNQSYSQHCTRTEKAVGLLCRQKQKYMQYTYTSHYHPL